MDALDGPVGEMVGKVDRARQAEPGQRLGNARPDALQRFDFGKQGIEYFGAHCGQP